MSVRRFADIWLSASLAFAALLPLHAQTRPGSYTVAEVHASGSHRYSDAQIAATAGLKPGDPVNSPALQEIADEMAGLGIFSRVNFRFTVKNNRAIVNFELEDAPVVPVIFENFPWFSDQEITDEIRTAVPLFDGVAPKGGTLLDEITDALKKKLASRGIQANVEHMLLAEPSTDGAIMQFRQDGQSFTVASLSFSDPAAQNSEKLHDRLTDLVGKNFSRFALELFENEQVRPIYLSAGQIRVTFGAPVVHLNGDGNHKGPATVDIQVPIDPGPVYRLSGVTWTGDMAIDQASLAKLIPLKEGDVADGMRLASGWQQVELEYAHRGYINAKVEAVPQFDNARRTVAYNVKITEGPEYRMGELVVTGLSLDAERSVRNAWRLPPGQVFDKTYVDSMLAKLEKPTVAIFGDLPVHYEKMGRWLRPDTQKHVMDVLIDFQ